jgi:hypothetical protein
MKLIARKMFAMTQEINNRFPDGKAHVSCYTCQRGQKSPSWPHRRQDNREAAKSTSSVERLLGWLALSQRAFPLLPRRTQNRNGDFS